MDNVTYAKCFCCWNLSVIELLDIKMQVFMMITVSNKLAK